VVDRSLVRFIFDLSACCRAGDILLRQGRFLVY